MDGLHRLLLLPFQRLTSWLNRHLPSTVHDDPEYQKAHDFKNRFQPKDAVDYLWVKEYARQIYDRLDQADQNLDAKAESIIKILGGGTGLLTLGAIINLPKLGFLVAVLLVLAVTLAFVAVFIAAWVRLPRQTFLPPSIAWALKYANSYQAAAEDQFLAQWHLACEGTRLAVLAKAKGVKLATYWAGAALLSVAISFFVAVGTMNQDTTSDKKGSTPMPTDAPSQQSIPPAPDPSGVSQTPDPATQAEPMPVERDGTTDPATQAEPQSLRESDDRSKQQR